MQMCCTADSRISHPQKREETLEKHLKVIEHRENTRENHERKPFWRSKKRTLIALSDGVSSNRVFWNIEKFYEDWQTDGQFWAVFLTVLFGSTFLLCGCTEDV